MSRNVDGIEKKDILKFEDKLIHKLLKLTSTMQSVDANSEYKLVFEQFLIFSFSFHF